MTAKEKSRIIYNWFCTHGGIPSYSEVRVDNLDSNVSKIFVNGSYFGTFDFKKQKFLHRSNGYAC